MNHFGFFLISGLLILPDCVYAASAGDFRTKASGNWNQTATWQYYNGASWVNATFTPTSANGDITVMSGHSVTVTASVSIDETDVDGYLTVAAGITLTILDGSGTDLSISNRVFVYGILANNGLISSSTEELVFYNNSVYKHQRDGGSVPNATWNDGSTCEISGIISAGSLGNTDQSFYHFKWNSTGQTTETNLAGDLETIRGNFLMNSTGSGSLKLAASADFVLTISGNWSHQGGTLNMGGSSASGVIIIHGNFSLSSGKITEAHSASYYSIIRFSKSGTQTFTQSSGTFENNIDFEVMSSSILDMGESVLSGSLGYFNLNSGATLRTAHAQGIYSSGASGCIRTSVRYFSHAAHYHFNRNGSQATGNGLPSSLNGRLTIGSETAATNLTLTNGSVTINNQLTLWSTNLLPGTIASGTAYYGASGLLEYRGLSDQNTNVREWPASSGPFHVTIHNSATVNLTFDRTIQGTLTLQQGSFSIGANTLTLRGAITQSSGLLLGGSSSILVVEGTSASLILPSVTLLNLFLNRYSGLTTSGNCSIHGTLNLISGDFNIGTGKTLYLLGQPVSGLTQNLKGGMSSGLFIGGTAEGFQVPPGLTVLGTLTIENPQGAELTSGILIQSQLQVSGKFIMGTFSVSGNGNYTISQNSRLVVGHPDGVAGNIQLVPSGFIDGEVDYEFNGECDQMTGFLPTSPPGQLRSLTYASAAGFTLSIPGPVNITGNLEITGGGTLIIDPDITVTVDNSVVIH